MHELAQSVVGYIRKHDLLRAGDRLGVAVSGGADSVALLRLLLDLRKELGIVISVVHLNHKLRDAESNADEQFVGELATAHGLEFICESRDVRSYAANKKLSLEAAAREVRYQFFQSLLLAQKLNKMATAHTLDDQAETVLLKLVRGAGTRGLAGIYPKVSVRHEAAIIRPLLGTSRKHLASYLGEIVQEWREDSSNRDLRHTRNRVRHGILPRLERHLNPAVREALAEAADIARGEEEYWKEEVAHLLPQVWDPTDFGASLNHNRLMKFGLALRRRLVRAAGAGVGLSLEFRHVEEVLALREEGARANLPADWVVSLQKGRLRFGIPGSPRYEYKYELSVPGEVLISEAGLRVKTSAVRVGSEQGGYNPEHLLDSRYAHKGLLVRNWHAGERFWPLHSKEPKKIKELLQDRHITGDEKKRWPVVASGDEIVWVRELGVRRNSQAKEDSGVLIQISDLG